MVTSKKYTYYIFEKIYLLHRPSPLSIGRNTIVFFCSIFGDKNTSPFAASFSRENNIVFSTVSFGESNVIPSCPCAHEQCTMKNVHCLFQSEKILLSFSVATLDPKKYVTVYMFYLKKYYNLPYKYPLEKM
jgi:hypothetical protein